MNLDTGELQIRQQLQRVGKRLILQELKTAKSRPTMAPPDVPQIRFHDLRHSCASLLLAQGVQLAEISLLLGHSDIRITGTLDSHLQKQTAAKAARHMDALFSP